MTASSSQIDTQGVSKTSEVDVLIIGAGPAGLMCAATLARYSKGEFTVRIVDKRSTKIFTGQADGLTPRSLEILQSLDIAPQLLREVNEMVEVCFWNPSGENGKLERTGRAPITYPDVSRFHHSTIHQGRVERVFLDKMAAWSQDAEGQPRVFVERGVAPDALTLPALGSSALSNDPKDRVSVRLRHLSAAEAKPAQFHPLAGDGLYRSNVFGDDAIDAAPRGLPEESVLEEVKARFVVGTDGARSWVRNALGFKLEGESANYFWGVVDGIPVTDFPDIRMFSTIHSANHGSVMVIPREDQIVRLYIQLPQPPAGQRPNRADVTPEKIMVAANNIMAPFKIEMPEIDWFTCYEIGQRLSDQWVWDNRVFCAGDAMHTHSPKAGQGMNISMQDTYNLTWKIAHVLQGKADPKILDTYHPERSEVANELIEFDHQFSRLFSGRPQKDVFDETGISMVEFKKAFAKNNQFMCGTSVNYGDSVLVRKGPEPDAPVLASKLPVGPRLKSHSVVCMASAQPFELGDLLPSDGRWRIIVFAGDVRISACRARLDALCQFLEKDPGSPVVRYTPKGADVDAAVECLAVLGSPRTAVESEEFSELFRPRKGKYGYRDYFKLFADDVTYHAGHGHVYEQYGIDPQVGCVVVVRPDQYVSMVTDVADHAGIATFFDGFMLPQN
ncbi:FAD binding domain-containing protein [Amylostereum chailletii]|nr:FAD binding domain-containing protein [Amylostereum chailletii]